MDFFGHFKTITYHKYLVMKHCFKVGLYRQGLLHDMSKYSPKEFLIGAKYYTGTCSPNAEERKEFGYSTAWLHHKGRNKHHLEYWLDYGNSDPGMVGHPMPTKYMVELCMDRIAACKVYHGDSYTDADPLDYLKLSRDSKLMHETTRAQVVEILTMLRDKGEEETFQYIRDVILKNPVKLYKNLPASAQPPEKKDHLPVSPERLEELAEELGTPFYLYREEEIISAAKTVQEAFSWNSKHRQFFPVKATPTAGILKFLKEQGQGVVCSSATELELCKKCGFTENEILFLPNYPGEEDLIKASEVGCMPVLDGFELIDDFAAHNLLSHSVGLRVKPEELFGFGKKQIWTDSMKFGMTPSQAQRAAVELKKHGVEEIGLHAYLSGNTLSKDYYPALAKFLLETADLIAPILKVSYINISGGIGLAYKPEEIAPDLISMGESVEAVFRDHGAPAELGLYTELGRFVTGPGGYLVTRVNHIKRSGRNYAGVDASAADLMRPMMYGAYHHITVAGKSGNQHREKWDVVGAVCENTDKFAENRMLPPLQVGDLLVVQDAGAHGHSMGYNYGGRLRCGEYLLHRDGTVSCLRRQEMAEDILKTQVF